MPASILVPLETQGNQCCPWLAHSDAIAKQARACRVLRGCVRHYCAADLQTLWSRTILSRVTLGLALFFCEFLLPVHAVNSDPSAKRGGNAVSRNRGDSGLPPSMQTQPKLE